MRKGWKKAVSTMLCAAMILSMSSFMVSADGETTIPETPAGDATTEVPGDEKDPEEQPPVNEEKDPADEEKDPADEEKDPADEEKDPADEEKDPADEEKDPADEEKDPADEEKDPADEEKDPSEVPGGPEQPSNSLPLTPLTPATPAVENGIMPMGEAICTVDGTVYPSVNEAIKNANGKIVTLIANVEEDVVVPENTTVTIELGNYTITNSSGHTITVKSGANLTITGNGTVDNVTHAKAAIWNEGIVTLNGGAYTRSEEAGASEGESGGNSYYNIVNHGNMTINPGVSVSQTGHFSSLIENGWYNGSENTDGSESVMVINGGTFSGGLNTIKNDDYGDLTIHGGNFKNTTQASLLNWNKATITGGTFESNASDAVILNGHIDEKMDQGILTISGGTFTATGDGDAIQDMQNGSEKEGGEITITGGEFNGDLNFGGKGSAVVNISDATINGDVMAADGVTATIKNSQVSGTVNGVESDDTTTTGDVAEINGTKYATLQEAIEHVNEGETIKILKDIPDAVGISVPEGKNFTIDFDGHTYTLVGPGAGSAGTETNAFQLLKDSTITFKNGTIRISEGANNVKRIIQNYANLTLENMQIYAQNQAGGEDYPLSFNNGNIVFKGNTSIYTSSSDNIAFDVCYWKDGGYEDGVSVTFEDYTGTINGVIIYDSTDEEKGKLEINGNGHFGKIDCSSGSENAAKEGIEIFGGTFTESVKEYVVESLNYELNSNGLYSYYSTLEEAKRAAGIAGGTIIDRKTLTVTVVSPTTSDDDTTTPSRPSGSHSTGSSSNSNVSYTRDPEQDKREAEENMWKRAINKINSARDGSSLKIYTGIVDEIPDYVLDALRENNVTVTFYNQDGDEVTIPAGMAPKSLRDSWTFKQLGNYVLSLDEVVTEVEETTETTQPAAEQNAEQNAQAADNTAKPNPETGDASSSMMAIAAAAASLCGVVLLSKKNK